MILSWGLRTRLCAKKVFNSSPVVILPFALPTNQPPTPHLPIKCEANIFTFIKFQCARVQRNIKPILIRSCAVPMRAQMLMRTMTCTQQANYIYYLKGREHITYIYSILNSSLCMHAHMWNACDVCECVFGYFLFYFACSAILYWKLVESCKCYVYYRSVSRFFF